MKNFFEKSTNLILKKFISFNEILKQNLQKHYWIIKPLRNSHPGHVVLCILLGIVVGLITIFLHSVLMWIHQKAFNLEMDVHLSSATTINHYRLIAVPIIGGLVLGIYMLLTKRWKDREIVDPIEANAIYGGKMSMIDNLRLLLSTLVSNASGASIGMEAAYTQMGSGFFSSIGQRLHLRRQDLRIFVAAGAAAAIAAAFNAPLAGAFYGFELVLGVYNIAAISQVAAGALAGALTLRIFVSDNTIFSTLLGSMIIPDWDYPLFMLLGIGSALIGILTMKSVVKCEHLTKKLPIASWAHPILGGVLIALLALYSPQVLGAGQGAIDSHLHEKLGILTLCLLLLFKISASAISIGTGFRGGLFSSSLFIGCLFGQIVGTIASHYYPQSDFQYTNFMLVGMASVAASVIGAPITMIMLLLETTDNFAVATGVLAGVLVSSAITRYYFGYSFSTWRFHLRGLNILGAHDVGWIKEIPVQKIMSNVPLVVNSEISLAEFRKLVPLGSHKKVFVVDRNNNYQGIIDVVQAYSHKLDKSLQTKVKKLAKGKDKYLLPHQDIKFALTCFKDFEMEELPVLERLGNNAKIIGYLTESYVLRRYSQELELQNAEKYDAASPLVT